MPAMISKYTVLCVALTLHICISTSFGGYRIFGSISRNTLQIEGKQACIDPIAGTTRRTGDSIKDKELAEALLADPKENAEHVMLVIWHEMTSRNCHDVRVVFYKEPQYYSVMWSIWSAASAGVLNKRVAPWKRSSTLPSKRYANGANQSARQLQLISEIEPLQHKSVHRWSGAWTKPLQFICCG